MVQTASGQGAFTVQVEASGLVNGSLLSISPTASIRISGSNTPAAARRVLVNEVEAAFDTNSRSWSLEASLLPGFNRMLVRVMAAEDVQILATNRDVVLDKSPVLIGGALASPTTFSNSASVYHVTQSLVPPPGGSVSIEPGCVFLVSPGASFLLTNATLQAIGTADAPIRFAPGDGSSVWGGVVASGTNSHILVQHGEFIAGHVQLVDGAGGALEDCYFHDYTPPNPPVIHTLGQPNPCSLTLSRCHVARYYEILCQLSVVRFEDCLMEYMVPGGDGIDFDAGQPGSVIRRCTLRHGNSLNIDALDMGVFSPTGEPTRGVLIDGCDLHDFADKGVSIGEQADVTVTNCLIHHVDAGIAVKDSSTAGIYGCTIAANNHGFHCYNKASPASPTGGGSITNSFNNIIWGNQEGITLLNASVLNASYSNFQDTNYPGTGNLSLPPDFLDPAGPDFRLAAGSPLLAAGAGAVVMGAGGPVGAPMAASHPELRCIRYSEGRVSFSFQADSERSYSLLATDSLAQGSWTRIAEVHPLPRPREATISDRADARAGRFYRLVSTARP
jgi:hypothetical protein